MLCFNCFVLGFKWGHHVVANEAFSTRWRGAGFDWCPALRFVGILALPSNLLLVHPERRASYCPWRICCNQQSGLGQAKTSEGLIPCKRLTCRSFPIWKAPVGVRQACKGFPNSRRLATSLRDPRGHLSCSRRDTGDCIPRKWCCRRYLQKIRRSGASSCRRSWIFR